MRKKTIIDTAAKQPKSVFEKKTASLSRWLHIYLSMLSFVVVLFFSVTGLTLNHAAWFDGKEIEQKYTGNVPVAWVNAPDTSHIKKMEIVELLRKSYGIKGYVSDFMIEDEQCSISFKGPGYSANAFIARKDGKFELIELKMGVGAVLNDLHKGRDTGKSWSWLIDVSANIPYPDLVKWFGDAFIFKEEESKRPADSYFRRSNMLVDVLLTGALIGIGRTVSPDE